MPLRRAGLAVLGALLVIAIAACSEPNRRAAADGLGDRLRALPSVAELTVSYSADSVETNESMRVLAIMEAQADSGDACAAVREFLERFPATGIEAREAQVEVRDAGDPIRWSFTAEATGNGPIDSTYDACVASQQARAIEAAYAVRATSGSDGAKPGVIVNFRSGAVASAQAGLAAARDAVKDFDAFAWSVYVICGEALCDRAEG